METIIEVYSRSGKFLERFRTSKTSFTLGRAFSCDVILSEPHISPHHVTVEVNESLNAWQLTDADTINGTGFKNRRCHGESLLLQSGDEVVMGKWRIRFYQSTHAVTETVRLTSADTFLSSMGQPLVIGIVLSLFVIYTGLQSQTSSLHDSWLSSWTNHLIGYLIFLAMWSALWTFVGRVSRHEMRFFSHFGTTALLLMILLLFEEFAKWLAFNWQSNHLPGFVERWSFGIFLGLALWSNMYLATNHGPKTRRRFSIGMAFLVIGYGTVQEHIQKKDFIALPVYSDILYHQDYYWMTPTSQEEFLTKSAQTFETAAQQSDDKEETTN
ncbi:MAG: FHA domain-containing protein [Pseudomonadota bacterium]